ncbi:MAG: tRNA 5-methoxyuridine(34)/uridine 5-oxyacetic acid(34) synthase CmoB [Melioribacteraceae bacterium]|nr:tRNA 5-methoxyuridine(34)/uridine 5-oxyacetic acid(34) synthase CmoB [Melioribacteraceae bacterium]
MIDYSSFFKYINENQLGKYESYFRQKIDEAFEINNDILKWQNAIDSFPQITPSNIDISKSTINIGDSSDCSNNEKNELKESLMKLHPWRKGPYNLFGNFIDTEWRSDWKWDRLKKHITPLKNKRVLDVGCGNGYHCWRMLGDGARSVTGIDPFILNLFQFKAINHFIKSNSLWVLPLKMEEFPQQTNFFDTIFSMGVLYHRRSPFDHLYELRDTLHSNGELVLETLVIDGKLGEVLVPEGRYAQMRNVWFIPSTLTLELWLKKSGFKNIRLVDVTPTTIGEQRSTDWMTFDSLNNFLSPFDLSKTIEGYPAPKRAVFIANSP